MAFASIHVPGFPIQSVVRAEPALRNRAIALVDGAPPVWNVIAANEAALRAGIQLGMAKSQAAQFASLEIRHRSRLLERAAHAALLDLGWSMSPRIEDHAPGTILADLTGLASLFGSSENIANEFAARASLLGLAPNVAIASNIEAALLASRGFSGIAVIPPGGESRQLGLLPVHVLPASAETLEILDRWGIRTCAALAALPLLDLSERLGQEGVRLHEFARGARVRSLALAQTSLCFEEEMELDDSVEDLEPLSFILGRLLGQLCSRLHARALAANSLHVRFQLDPAFGEGLERPGKKPRPASVKKPAAAKVYEKSLNLPVPMRDSKMLLNLLRLHLQSAPPAAPILKISVSAVPARPRPAQGGLFRPLSPDPEKLELTVVRLANLVGDSNIGSPELIDTHRPGEFRIGRLLSLSAGRSVSSRPTRADSNAALAPGANTPPPATAFRVFRPPIPAKVEVRDARPVFVSFNTLCGSVIAASGPWRTSGDWWREDTWQHDEWDLQLRFESLPDPLRRRFSHATPAFAPSSPRHGVYCVCFDLLRQSWFVRGIYD